MSGLNEATVVIYPEDPHSDVLSDPAFQPIEEEYTNVTMDQAILSNYNGLGDYMNDHFLNDDGTVTAELDIRLTQEQFSLFYGHYLSSAPELNVTKRKATRPLRYRWTNNIVPYQFYPGHFSANEVYQIKAAMQRWADTTCLQFRPAGAGDRNRMRFQNGAGCNSQLGMVGGTQAVNLQAPGCRHRGLYLHEVGHAIGLVHEHQLPDRDEYITINYNNVSPSLRIWFNKYSTREVNQYGVPYEYSSVMHYGITAFAYDGRSQTIVARDRSKEHLIGQVWAKDLSFSDIKVVNLMYQCNKHCGADSSCQSPGYLNKNCQCVCPSGVDCNSGEGGGGTGCTNEWSDEQCQGWANQGECDANPEFMRVNCRKACRTCGTTTTTTTTTMTTTTEMPPTPSTTYMPSPPPSTYMPSTPPPTTTSMPSPPPTETTTSDPDTTTPVAATTTTPIAGITTTTPSGPPTISPQPTTTTTSTPTAETTYMPSPPPSTTTMPTTTTTGSGLCVNQWGDQRCNQWQARGECRANPNWMGMYCSKACGTCEGGGNGCRDQNQWCSAWARQGYCSHNAHVQQNCRRSCNTCGGGRGNIGGSSCTDQGQHCASWAASGYCTHSYVTYMTQNCRASCNLC